MGKNSASDEAKKARKAEEKRQKEVRTGTARIDKVFGQFDKGFYGGQEEAYRDYATPQLQDQYGDAGEDLTYHLARRGLLDSSVRGEKEADLGKLFETNRQKVVSDAKAYGTDARSRVEDARANLITTLQSTGDAKGAAGAALRRADALSRPPSYSPLEQIFVNFTAGLGQQAGLERAHAAGGPKPRYGPFLYGPGSGRAVVNT